MSLALKELQSIKDSAKGFAGLMSLYEKNYVRFNQLVTNLDEMDKDSESFRAGDIALHLQILERCRYTTTVLLTYRMSTDGDEIRTPDLKIRLYHDARQAEVMSCCRHDTDSFKWLERSVCRTTLQWRWRMNHFLYKWLNHCLKSGHHFSQYPHGISWHKLLKSLKN